MSVSVSILNPLIGLLLFLTYSFDTTRDVFIYYLPSPNDYNRETREKYLFLSDCPIHLVTMMEKW